MDALREKTRRGAIFALQKYSFPFFEIAEGVTELLDKLSEQKGFDFPAP